ncbi:MAG: AgmX/PglI C-terminal domain-containing protein [Myxococcales bacterium]|nr:AgmX/PglI C-terminal domain-containing protein [Myxococcales bacterium]
MTLADRLVPLLALALTLAPACKKEGESAPPSGGGEVDGGGDDGDAGDGDGGAAEQYLSQGVFEEEVQGHMDDVGECYGQASADNPELAGKVIVNFTIAGDGSVSAAEIDEGSTLNDEAMNTCLKGKIAGWRFSKTSSGEPMSLVFPFNLSPG